MKSRKMSKIKNKLTKLKLENTSKHINQTEISKSNKLKG